MVKRIGRRFVSLLLTFVTILTMLPAMTLPALAAKNGTVTGLADQSIGLSFSGNTNEAWSELYGVVTGTAKATKSCGTWSAKKSTLTITNNRSTPATLSFAYTISQKGSSTIKVGKDSVTKSGKFSTDLGSQETVTVSIESGRNEGEYATINLSNFLLVQKTEATTTFLPAGENGSYTVDRTPITEAYTNTQSSMTAYQVVATPAQGYQFMDWYDVKNEKSISTSAKTALNIESDCTITARFTTSGPALFEIGGLVYDELANAITAARGKTSAIITLVGDGTISGSYTIPANVTLLIPFNAGKTCYKDEPIGRITQPQAKPYKTLTMAEGSSITLENKAAISVGGQYYAAGGGQSGKMVGPYGYIKMGSGSAITVRSGASLYAWGFISGSGSVSVESGGSVYEWYQILDFRGGTATSKMENKVFPFNQYAVQNIEVPLTLHAGANEKAYVAITANDDVQNSSISFIGDKGMFKLNTGSRLTKAYDGSTDRMIYTIDGTAELNALSLKLAGMDVNSKDYVLPLTNNMTVDLNSGSKLTMNQTAALLPGVEVTIARNAELVVPSKQSMYIYDVDEWGGYCGAGDKSFIPVGYAPGKTYNRTEKDLVDVKVDVNGKLTAIGSVYTTESGANICSSEGTGKYVQQSAPGTGTKTYQYTQKNGVTAHEIPITAAKLKNADNFYFETSTANAGDTITYCTCPRCGGKWDKIPYFAAICNSDGTQTGIYPTLQDAVNNYTPDSNTYIKLLHDTTENIDSPKNLCLDLNGCTVTGTFDMGNNTLYGMDSTTDNYDSTTPGKLDGTVTGKVALVHETSAKKVAGYDSLRYVAIKNEDGTEYTFHRFNISVTGYRFELAAPQCALIFRGEFRGDDEAKKHLKSLGFTLTDKDGKSLGTDSSPITDPKDIPKESEPGESKVVLAEDGAYLFELYLKRSFEKNPPDIAYTEEFFATAQATFKNGGTQVSGTKDSKTQHLSFQKAWQNALDPNSSMKPEDKEILQKFLDEFGINIQAE